MRAGTGLSGGAATGGGGGGGNRSVWGIAVLVLVLGLVFVNMLSAASLGNGDGADSATVAALAARVEVLTRELQAARTGGGGGGSGGGGQKGGGGGGGGSGRFDLSNRNGDVVDVYIPPQVTMKELNFTVPYREGGRDKTMNIFVMGTTTNPPFSAALAHPKREAASADVFQNGDMEKPTRRLFEFLLLKRCSEARAAGKPLHVLDAGANLGYFSTYSAVCGCQVTSVEMQPRLIPIIKMGPAVNGISDRTTVHNNVIHTDPEARVAVSYAPGMCWGCSHVKTLAPGAETPPGEDVLQAARLDSLVDRDLVLFKVDIEGYEVIGIESFMSVIRKRKVDSILIEWAPRRWPHEVARGDRLLEELHDLGYVIRAYDLRYPLGGSGLDITVETWPLIGKTWRIERKDLAAANKYLYENKGYGEINFFISRVHPIQD